MKSIQARAFHSPWRPLVGALISIFATGIATIAIPALAIPSVWTQHNDNGRTGQNLSETILTPANVTASTFGQLFHYTLDDQSFGQPLYVPGLTMAVDGAVHNVVFVSTVNNSVYAFDGDSGTVNGGNPLWHVNLTASGARVPNHTDGSNLGACGGAYEDFHGNMGTVGASVIDTSTNTLYVASKDINGSTWTQRLHALDCTSGAEKFGGPIVVSGSYAGTNFTPSLNNQRPALTLVNGIVYVAFSSYCDNGAYHGYVIGYNKSTLAQTAAWADTNSNGSQGGIWMGGQGIAADSSNNLYLMTGNGTWDGSGNFGESFVKLSSALTETDYFTPNTWSTLNGGDYDLGSAGCVQIPGTNYIFGGGKMGITYLVNTANMGHENGTDQVVQEFQATFPQNGDTGHIHGGPVYFNNGSAQYVYLWGENDFCRQFQFNGTSFNTTAVNTSTMRAPTSGVGMPGGFLSLSANGTSNGIVWANTSYNGDANQDTVPGILHAFNASNLTELWNSEMNATRDSYGNFSKDTYPTIANGKVYVGTFGTADSLAGSLYVYGNITAPTEGPYGGTAAAVPGTVQAENYDTGGQGVGYSVTSVNGSANSYRSDGVDLEACTDTGGGYDLGWSAAGQWTRYTVNVATAGTYTVALRVASGATVASTCHIQNASGTNLSGSITVPVTGGWQTWATVNATVTLPAGQQVLTLSQDSAGYNVNYLTFTAASSGDQPFGGTPAAIPGTVHASNYDTGGQGVAYNAAVNGTGNSYRSDGIDLEACTDTGGGYDLGWTATGQWFHYTVNVATAGTYTVACRVASGATTAGTFQIQNAAGTNLSGVITAPVTGGWQTWTTVNATVTLPAGQQVLTVYQDSANFNINYLAFTTSAPSCTTAPSAPGTPTASGTTSTSTNLSWGAVTPPANCTISSYEVYKNGTALASTSSTTYTATGLTPSTAYTFTVAAVDGAGTGAKSGAVNVTTSASGGEAPYGGTAAAIPGTVQAENYDTGGQGVAYNATSTNGSANSYRSDGIDLEACADTGGGYDLGWTASPQWFKYTVNVAAAGTYTVSFRLAAPAAITDGLHISNSSGTNLSGSVNVPATGGYQTWTTVTANVTLPAGQQVLTVNQDNGAWNINYMSFASSGGASGSLSGAVTPITAVDDINLTTLGTTDWAAWGYNTTSYFDHDASGGSQISTASVYGGGTLAPYNNTGYSFFPLTWTNGTPDATATNEQWLYVNGGGVGDGFQFTAPATTTSHKLLVYVGGWESGGTLTATLSDGSAATYTDSSQVNTGASYYAVYTLTYNAASSGQKLTVVWKQASGTGNLDLVGAAMQ